MNAPLHITVAPTPPHIVAAADKGIKDNYLAVQLARVARLYDLLGEEGQGFVEEIAALCTVEERHLEDSAPLNTMHDHQRRYFGATRGLAR